MKKIILLVLAIIVISPSLKATETLTFSDDFKSGTENWNLESGWSIISDGGNPVLQGTEHTFAATYIEGIAGKLELKLRLQEGGIHLNIRSAPTDSGLNRYFVGLNKGGSYIQKQLGNEFQELKGGGTGISLSEWHQIRVEIVQEKINVFVDNNLILSAQDQDLLKEGGISFETLENSIAEIDDVKIDTQVPDTRNILAEDLFPEGKHKGDITLQGREVLVLEQGKFEQFGNIYLKDSSQLIIRDASLKISRYQRLLNHWGIHLESRSSLAVENSELIPGEGALFVIEARERAKISLKDSPTQVHLFSVFGSARAVVENSKIVGEIGGLVSAYDKADIKVVNSEIGAVNLYIPNRATFEASGLRTGFFEKWNLHQDARVSGINYNITLINTGLVKDAIGPGPFERGWPLFIDSGAKVKIENSELRKVVIELNNEKAEFANFSLETPTNFRYRNISLEKVKVMGQWGVFIHGDSDVIVRDSDAFWTFIYDEANLTLINTHMNEFDPRNFKGRLIFNNVKWDTAAEIIGNNDFTMEGSIEIGEIGGFSWETSKVTRAYDMAGKPNSEITLRKGEEIVWQGKTDENGRVSFSIKFEDATFDDRWIVQDNFGHNAEISFFSKTPFDIQQKIKIRAPQNQPPPFLKPLVPGLALLVLIVLSLFIWKKYLKGRVN